MLEIIDLLLMLIIIVLVIKFGLHILADALMLYLLLLAFEWLVVFL